MVVFVFPLTAPLSLTALSLVGRIMPPPKDVHVLFLRICEYVRLPGKGELRLQMELSLLISEP